MNVTEWGARNASGYADDELYYYNKDFDYEYYYYEEGHEDHDYDDI